MAWNSGEYRPQITELCRRYHVREMYLFGSATTDQFDAQHSDVDLLVRYDPNTSLGPWLRDFFALKAELEKTLNRPVDLVMESGLRDDYFRRTVETTRKLIYAS